jgi:hypothetical protein
MDELGKILESGDVARCVSWLEEASEADRRAQAPLAAKRLETYLEGSMQETAKGQWSWVSPWSSAQREAARIATLGTATLGELRRLGQNGVPPPAEQETAIEMLAVLRPAWLLDWAETLVDIAPRNWRLARRLVRDGLSRKPTSANYALGMLDRASFEWGGPSRQVPLADQLLEDPALLHDEVFRLFEVEGAGELSLAAHDKYSAPIFCWEEALAALAARGHLPRARLLDASLDALSRDLPQFQAGWFSRFHERLAPTLEERTERWEHYARLLTSPIPPTVSFALDALIRIDDAGRVRPQELCEELRPALRASAKRTAAAAVKLLAKIAQENSDLRAAAALALTEALSHERSDVQVAALKVIEKHGRRADPHLLAAMKERSEGVASSLRSRMQEWIGSAGVVKTEPVAPAVLAPLPKGPADVVPISGIDELIDACALVLEQPDRPDEIERALAGMSLLCEAAPEEMNRRAAPLLKRARALIKDVDRSAPLRVELARVVVAWLTGEHERRSLPSNPDVPTFLSARLDGLIARVASRRPAPLLAAPTRTDGVVAPTALVDRLKKTTAPEPHDLVVAFLRLGRGGRADALVAARDVAGEVGQALRHALGGPEAEVGPTAWLWIAAARARDPAADDPRVEVRHRGLGPGAGRAGRVVPHVRQRVHSYQDRGREKTVTFHWIECDREPALPREIPLLHLPVMLHSPGPRPYPHVEGVAGQDENMIRWALSLWPEWKEPLFVEGLERISANLDWWEARWHERAFLEPLAETTTSLTGSALDLLSVALAAKEIKIQGLAIDALVAGIADGRLDGSALGARMSELLPTGLIKPARWAKSLSDAARVSREHTAAVATILQRALRGEPPRDIGSLLAVLVELLAETGQRVDDAEAVAYLRVLAGKGGAAAKAARSLLA